MDDNVFVKDAELVSWVIKYNPDKIKNEEIKINKNIESIQKMKSSGKRLGTGKLSASYIIEWG